MLDTYFRRGATSYLATQQAKLKEIRSAMEMVFGFLEAELRSWIETVLAKDTMYEFYFRSTGSARAGSDNIFSITLGSRLGKLSGFWLR